MRNSSTSARNTAPLMVLAIAILMLIQGCSKSEPAAAAAAAAAIAIEVTPVPGESEAAKPVALTIDADSFSCLTKMTAIRHFFVDNLLGHLAATVAVAESSEGGVYPPGSVVQLVPTEVMVKHPPGFNAATRDWEFFELDVSAEGSVIRNRGFVDVVNKFGGNCLGCHIKAEPKYDLICELDHGCDPIPVTREMIAAIQAGRSALRGVIRQALRDDCPLIRTPTDPRRCIAAGCSRGACRGMSLSACIRRQP